MFIKKDRRRPPNGVHAMTRSCQTSLLAALALMAAPAVAPAQTSASAAAGTPFRMALVQIADDGVLDEAGLFSHAALAAARDKIHQIRKDYHCAVLIDTVNQPPASDRSKANSWLAWKRVEYFHDWAKVRSQELGVEGIHILICKQPRQVAVVAWPERFEVQFNRNDCTGIERLLKNQLVSTPDDALLTALDRVRADLQAHRQPEPPSVPLGPLGVFIAGAIGVWLLLALVRLRWHKPDPFSLTAEPHTVLLTAGMLAGMFGNPATHWITDRLFPHESTGSVPDIVLEDVPPAQTPAAGGELFNDVQSDETAAQSEHAEIQQD
jgi:hypothetical protein